MLTATLKDKTKVLYYSVLLKEYVIEYHYQGIIIDVKSTISLMLATTWFNTHYFNLLN